MLMIRDIMYCKPGKVRPLVEKFLAMARYSDELGWGSVRVMTDVSAERFWTVVAEIEAPTLEDFMKMGAEEEGRKRMAEIMEGYHDLVDHGRREIYTIES